MFLLYTRLAGKSVADGSAPFAGLGYVDSRKPIMTVQFELVRPKSDLELPRLSKGVKRRKAPKTVKEDPTIIEIQLIQDTTALRSRKGDTGSVLWKVRCSTSIILVSCHPNFDALSVLFARIVLEQHLFDHGNALLNYDALEGAHVLELG